ncbi:MAG: hypothetical protein AUK48_05745 [Oscillatoriales cyanobacterium CG2_30_44_21]|nr:MAG: hypothetical protein AUK48_05745 [Oscillatoriales cyanobacterium CG2_30_44_21]
MTAQYQAALHSYAEGRYEDAMQQFSELLYEDPRNPKLHIWLGATFRKAGKTEYARAQYQQVLTLTDDPDLLDLASTSLAQIQNKLAHGDLARSIGSVAVAVPENSTLHMELGMVQQEASQGASSNTNGRNSNGHQSQTPNQVLKLSAQNGSASNGLNGNGSSLNGFQGLEEYISSDDQATVINDLVDEDVTGLARSTDATQLQESSDSHAFKLGLVPPPPAIAVLIKKKSMIALEERGAILETGPQVPENSQDPDDQIEEIGGFEEIGDSELTESRTSIFSDTIASMRNGHQSAKKSENSKEEVFVEADNASDSETVVFDGSEMSPMVYELIDNPKVEKPKIGKRKKSTTRKRNDKSTPANSDNGETSAPIALEDMFKLSSVRQKITLLGALIATVPAIAIGVVTYQIGDGLLLGKARQQQRSQAVAIARTAESFLQQKVGDVKVLQNLLMSGEVGKNTLQKGKPAAKPSAAQVQAQQRQYQQQLANRLNLYSQAYPQYSSMAIFSTNGNVLAQTPTKSANAAPAVTLDPSLVAQVTATDNVLLNDPVVIEKETYVYALVAVKSSLSQKVDMILQVEIPLEPLKTSLKSDIAAEASSTVDKTQVGGKTDFYLINSSSRYVASSQAIDVGGDAVNDFSVLPQLKSANAADLRDITRGDRNMQILAYAPVEMQGYGLAPWDVVTTVNKSAAAVGSQQLLMAIGLGLAGTPLLVAAIAYALSRKLSSRLKEVRSALKALLQGGKDSEFVALSVSGNDELSDISASINTMTSQFQIMLQKQEQEKQRLQLQVMKLFKVLTKLARDEKQNLEEEDLTDENILNLGKRVRAKMVQGNAELESHRHQKEKLQGQLMDLLKEMQALASGDLSISSKAVNSDLKEVSVFFDDVMRGLQDIVNQIKSSATQVNLSLGQNEQAIANLASVSQRQVDVVTRSLNTAQMSKLSATKIIDNSQQALQTSQAVAECVADSDRSIDSVMDKVNALQSTVSATAKRVQHLGESSQKVAKAISTINEIAVKTNFLAISATLAASRKSDNSFVMVAEEVGELASRSVAVSKEVEALISNIQIETGEVMAVVETGSQQVAESTNLAIAAKDSLQQISLVSQQIGGLMSSISEATLTQVQTSEGIANLMKDISHIAQRTLTSSGEVAKFIRTTKRHSGDLQKSLSQFKTR